MSSQIARSGSAPRAAPRAIAWGAASLRAGVHSVALPLTGPVLIGLRARTATDGRLEMLLSNPGGGRGIYVTSWPAVRLQAMPSLHDIRLIEILQSNPAAPLSPGRILAAARGVAIEGYAGRPAAQAARKAEAAGGKQLLRLRSHLLLELARALDMPASHSDRNDPWSVGIEEQATWLRSAPGAVAAQLGAAQLGAQPMGAGDGWTGETLSAAVAALAQEAVGLGFGPARDRFRLPRILALMARTAASGPGPMAASLLARHGLATEALDRARARFDDPLGLLAEWQRDPPGAAETLGRPGWLLDGWDRLCLVQADPAFAPGTRKALAQLLTHDSDGRVVLEHTSLERGSIECSQLLAMQPGTALTLDRLECHERLRLAELLLDCPDSDTPGAGGSAP
ncbi:hypothetical protein [Lichenicoccus sp.]|uniref:hypothetical protein n=1 Tax=Lichenicoccus sp. TaxID=2781899 RepID=UPI003D0EA75D